MIIAITDRYYKDKTSKVIPEYFRYPKQFKDIFEELNIILFPIASLTNIKEIVKFCDGLIVSGRAIDLNPKYYNEEAIEATNLCKEYDGEDPLDFTLIKAFHEANKPILGICAGLQSINVVFGGSLYQDIPNHCIEEIQGRHKIQIQENSFIYQYYQEDKIQVNSLHHQAIKEVAKNFKVTAISEEGIVEAIEYNNIIGVQWHPEVMMDIGFFKKFIETYC